MPKRPLILLRSSWQTVNIGDIAHSPGLLRALQKHLPDAELVLWPNYVDRGVREMLERHLPSVKIAEGVLDSNDQPSTPELAAALRDSDFFLHGSAPCLAGKDQVEAWRRLRPGAPYGFFGVSYDPTSGQKEPFDGVGVSLAEAREIIEQLPQNHLPADDRNLIDGAEFFLCRDSLTRRYLELQGIRPGTLGFAPDGAFSCDIRDEERAVDWMQTHGLIAGEFICVLPRSRYTPRDVVYNVQTVNRDRERARGNQRFEEADHAKLREVMIRWVRETGHKIVVCPEMTYQIQLGRVALVDPLPDDVREQTIWREDYWLTDKAAAVYACAAAMVSLENHSPILSLAAGTPVLFCRQPTDSIKGQMWNDIGMGNWFFEIEETGSHEIYEELIQIVNRPDKAARKIQTIMSNVDQWQQEGIELLNSRL